jgi:hypothetical protein
MEKGFQVPSDSAISKLYWICTAGFVTAALHLDSKWTEVKHSNKPT